MGMFIQSLPMLPHWEQIAWEINCTDKYKHIQNLNAVFHNASNYVIEKAELFKKANGFLPSKELRELCYNFRNHFPETGRREGIRYFDERIEDFISNKSFTEYWIAWLSKNKSGLTVIGIIIACIAWVLFKVKIFPI